MTRGKSSVHAIAEQYSPRVAAERRAEEYKKVLLAERKTSADRIALLEGALANAHKVFAAEIETLHRLIPKPLT